VRYVRPCPLMPSVTMGIDAAVTANTNSSNTATREINAPPNFFQGPSFWSPQNPHPATTRTIFQRPRVDAVLPPASFSRAIASKYSLRDRVCSAAPARGLPLDRPAMTQGRPLMRSAIAGPVGPEPAAGESAPCPPGGATASGRLSRSSGFPCASRKRDHMSISMEK
jgi:hypothetical protein